MRKAWIQRLPDLLEDQVKALEKQGAIVKEVSLPNTEYGVATYYILAPAEASSNLARYDGVRYGYQTDVDAVREKVKERDARLAQELKAMRKEGNDAARLNCLKKKFVYSPRY